MAKAINNNTVGSKVVATVSDATLTIDGQVVGMDYEVIPADLLTGLVATSTKKGEAAYGDAQYVIDLANKAAADAGFEYTYREAGELMRPHYPLNPLEVSDAADKGFTILLCLLLNLEMLRQEMKLLIKLCKLHFQLVLHRLLLLKLFVKHLQVKPLK